MRLFGLPAVLAWLGLIVGGLSWSDADAHHLVKRHKITCNADFPCPRRLRPRVDFWIDVYTRWTSKDAVLHDSNKPDRVYDVIRGHSCKGRKGSTLVKRQRAAIAGELRSLAKKITKRKKVWGTQARHLLQMFPRRDPAEMRRAAANIRCQGGNRDRFRKALQRHGTYRSMVQNVLRKSGLPPDTQYLPFVESLYNPAAYSHLGAAGLWQIMPSTARSLGLKLNATVDERLDPEAASWAAARYLKDSRRRLKRSAQRKRPKIRSGELNPFVITSYNYGVNGMERAIKKLGPDFMRVLERYRSRKFRVAVKNFYASFLAARHVAQNSTRYFGKVSANPKLRYRTLTLKRPTSVDRLQAVFGVSTKQLKKLNPALTRYVWKGWRPVPKGYRLRLPAKRDGWGSEVRRLSAMGPERDVEGVFGYIVKRGDSVCSIARVFGVPCRELLAMNRLGKRGLIRVGQTLQVPSKSVTAKRSAVPANPGSYIVRRGDTGCGIAKRFAVGCHGLLVANQLTTNSILQPGYKLIIPGVLTGLSATTSYTVRQGDSVCEISKRLSVTCDDLLSANSITMSDLIFPGQTLRVPRRQPGTVARVTDTKQRRSDNTPSKTTESNLSASDEGVSVKGMTVEYVVRKGDSACKIASGFETNCAKLLKHNGLNRTSVIVPGQILQVPDVPVDLADVLILESDEKITDTEPGLPSDQTQTLASVNPLDREIDLAIQTATRDGKVVHRINVEPEETIGHYSDWLKLGSTKSIRALNGFDNKQQLHLGQVLLLPVKDEAQSARFERERRDYHRVLVEEFKEHYVITQVTDYITKRGDSLWQLARTRQIPSWLIMRYNPILRSNAPVVGQNLKMPSIRQRED